MAVTVPQFELGLTIRQKDVLACACEGLTCGQTATRLGCAEQTVRHHRSAILDRLGAMNIAEACYRAAQLGLVS